jgi:predicted metalloendopeptidase
MSRFKVKIGYPDEWIDYSSLNFGDQDKFLTMVLASQSFKHRRMIKEINAPTDL